METKEPKKQEEILKTTNVNVKYAIRAEQNMQHWIYSAL